MTTWLGLPHTPPDYESCQTCKYRTGTRCNKIEEYIDDEDWCGDYKSTKIKFDDALKDYIQRHPEEYEAEIHEHLFTKEELNNLSQSLRR
jgi:hypothetical protein